MIISASWGTVCQASGPMAEVAWMALLPDDGPSGQFVSWDGSSVPR